MNDELTPSERAALRARIVGGARGITPVGAHRGAWIAGSIAAVLVIAVAGGVVATSTLSAPPIASTPSPPAPVEVLPVPTATPAPTPPPTVDPASPGSAPFAGSCKNVIDLADVESATGLSMAMVGPDWTDGTATLRGGLLCSWWSSQEFAAASVEVAVFPIGQTPTVSALVTEPGCAQMHGNFFCARQGETDGMKVWVRTKAAAQDVADRGAVHVLEEVLPRVGQYPVGVAAVPRTTWWSELDCARVNEVIDADSLSLPYLTVEASTLESRGALCTISSLSADTATSWSATISVVPGGAVDVPSIVAAGGEAVDVAGATEALWVLWHDNIDGAGSMVLTVSDGVNLMLVDVPYNEVQEALDLSRAKMIAERVLPLL